MAIKLIDSYQFGLIVVNGRRYTSDVIIFPDRVSDSWQRRSGHLLCLEDIAEVIAEKPEVLVVGTGASGLMTVLPEVQSGVGAKGIKLIVEITENAGKLYNQLCQSQTAVAALHITC